MLPLGPLTSSLGSSYSAVQVAGLLSQPSLQMRWLFDLLGPDLHYKADLSPLVDNGLGGSGGQAPQIDHDSTRAVMRTLRINFLRPVVAADLLQDLVRVRYQILAPDGGWLEWQIGLFPLQPPTRVISEAASGWQLTLPDCSQLLVDAAFTAPYTVQAGQLYSAAVAAIVTGYGGAVSLRSELRELNYTLRNSMTWDAGSSRLSAVNDLLNAIGYTAAWLDGAVLRSAPVPIWYQETPAYTFNTTQGSTAVLSPATETPDYSHAFNQFRVNGEHPANNQTVTGYYENLSALSPISIPNGRPRMAPVIQDSSIPSNQMAQQRAQLEAQKAALVYAAVSWPFLPWPFSTNLDIYQLVLTTADEGTTSRRYLNTAFSHPCAKQATTMTLQRVVAS